VKPFGGIQKVSNYFYYYFNFDQTCRILLLTKMKKNEPKTVNETDTKTVYETETELLMKLIPKLLMKLKPKLLMKLKPNC
jgi:hypothetical protein